MSTEIGSEGVSYQITVQSDAAWTATGDAPWLAISIDNNSDEGKIVVTVAPNTTGLDRTASIVIDGQTHTLTQRADQSASVSDRAGNFITTVVSRHEQSTDRAAAATTAAHAANLTPGLTAAAALSGSNYGNVYRADRNFVTRIESAGGTIRAVAATSDGGFVVVGSFSTIGGQTHLDFAKYKSDGTLDASINSDTGCDNEISAVAVQPDGKFVVVGNFNSFNGTARPGIARLNANGTLDTAFNPGGGFDANVSAVVIQPDGKIIVSGLFTSFDGNACNRLVRLTSTGAFDATFNIGAGFGKSVSILPLLLALAVQSDGKIVVGGTFDSFNGTPCKNIARLNANGTLDTAFSVNTGSGFGPGPDSVSGVVLALALQSDGRIVAGGNFSEFNGTACKSIARLNANGTFDATFAPADGFDSANVEVLAMQSDGQIIAGGAFTAVVNTAFGYVVRLNTNGTVDTTFQTGTAFEDGSNKASVSTLAVLTDGRVVVGGSFTKFNDEFHDQNKLNLVRLTSEGALDTLAPGALRKPGMTTTSLVAGGKLIVAGSFGFVNGVGRTGIARLNMDGSLDTSFALTGSGLGDGIVSRVAVQNDGKLVVAGDFAAYNGTARVGIARLNSDGSLDPSFDPGTGFDYTSTLFGLVLQPDGKILAAGGYSIYNGVPRVGIARINANGSLDTTFNPGSGFDGTPVILSLLSDGKIVVGGGFAHYNGASRSSIARLNTDGSVDPSFNPGTGFTYNLTPVHAGNLEAMIMQPDGKIVAGGSFTMVNDVSRTGFARLNANGSLDAAFVPGMNIVGFGISAALQPDGRIIVGGVLRTGTTSAFRPRIVRFNADGSLDSSFSAVEMTGTMVRLGDDGRLFIAGAGAVGPGVVQVGFGVLSPDPLAPVFTTQPVSVTVNAGDTATFTVAANGVPAPTYQWFKLPSTSLPGKTDATLILTLVQPSDAGLYVAGAINSAGDDISLVAMLTVNSSSSSSSSGGGSSSSSSGGYGGGGGGAPSTWFVTLIITLLAAGGRRLAPPEKR